MIQDTNRSENLSSNFSLAFNPFIRNLFAKFDAQDRFTTAYVSLKQATDNWLEQISNSWMSYLNNLLFPNTHTTIINENFYTIFFQTGIEEKLDNMHKEFKESREIITDYETLEKILAINLKIIKYLLSVQFVNSPYLEQSISCFHDVYDSCLKDCSTNQLYVLLDSLRDVTISIHGYEIPQNYQLGVLYLNKPYIAVIEQCLQKFISALATKQITDPEEITPKSDFRIKKINRLLQGICTNIFAFAPHLITLRFDGAENTLKQLKKGLLKKIRQSNLKTLRSEEIIVTSPYDPYICYLEFFLAEPYEVFATTQTILESIQTDFKKSINSDLVCDLFMNELRLLAWQADYFYLKKNYFCSNELWKVIQQRVSDSSDIMPELLVFKIFYEFITKLSAYYKIKKNLLNYFNSLNKTTDQKSIAILPLPQQFTKISIEAKDQELARIKADILKLPSDFFSQTNFSTDKKSPQKKYSEKKSSVKNHSFYLPAKPKSQSNDVKIKSKEDKRYKIVAKSSPSSPYTPSRKNKNKKKVTFASNVQSYQPSKTETKEKNYTLAQKILSSPKRDVDNFLEPIRDESEDESSVEFDPELKAKIDSLADLSSVEFSDELQNMMENSALPICFGGSRTMAFLSPHSKATSFDARYVESRRNSIFKRYYRLLNNQLQKPFFENPDTLMYYFSKMQLTRDCNFDSIALRPAIFLTNSIVFHFIIYIQYLEYQEKTITSSQGFDFSAHTVSNYELVSHLGQVLSSDALKSPRLLFNSKYTDSTFLIVLANNLKKFDPHSYLDSLVHIEFKRNSFLLNEELPNIFCLLLTNNPMLVVILVSPDIISNMKDKAIAKIQRQIDDNQKRFLAMVIHLIQNKKLDEFSMIFSNRILKKILAPHQQVLINEISSTISVDPFQRIVSSLENCKSLAPSMIKRGFFGGLDQPKQQESNSGSQQIEETHLSRYLSVR